MKGAVPARFQAVLAAVLFSTGGAAIKTEALTAAQVSALRSGVAALVILAFVRGRIAWSPAALGIGIVYAATLTLFVAATKLTTAANAIFLQSTAPLYLLLLAPLLLGERVHRRDGAYVAAVAAGMICCFLGQARGTATAPDPATGNLLALACGVSWALTLLFLRWAQRDGTEGNLGLTAVIAGNAIACLIALPFAWPFPVSAPAAAWVTALYLGVFQIGVAYLCLTSAMRHLPALDASLLLLLEPVLNPVWTWTVRGERPGTWTIAGGAVIVAAAAAKAVYDARSPVRGDQRSSPRTTRGRGSDKGHE